MSKPVIVTAVMLPTRELLYRPSNTRMGDYLTHPHTRIGALLFYPPESRRRYDEEPRYDHERFLLDADTTWHVERRVAPAPPPESRNVWWTPDPPRLYATRNHAFVTKNDIRRALWVIEHWLEEVL